MKLRSLLVLLLLLLALGLFPMAYAQESRSYQVFGLPCAGCKEGIVEAVRKIEGVTGATLEEQKIPGKGAVGFLVVVHSGPLEDPIVIKTVEGVHAGLRCERAPE